MTWEGWVTSEARIGAPLGSGLIALTQVAARLPVVAGDRPALYRRENLLRTSTRARTSPMTARGGARAEVLMHSLPPRSGMGRLALNSGSR